MDANQNYTDQLEQALLGKTERMDGHELKQLRDDYKLFQSAFQGIYNVLLRKGLIHEDPYKLELKISEVQTPPEGSFAESEKLDQMCIRLSQFESYLDFLNNYYQFSVDFLTLGRIKKLVGLTKYFSFTTFTENSSHLNTRYFAEIVAQIRKGSDPLSTGIINEGLLQLDKTSRKIFQALKDLGHLHRERHKLEMRRLASDSMKFDRDQVITHQDDVIRKIRQKFVEAAGDKPFYPELAVEILKEDYSSDGPSLRDEALEKLRVADSKDSGKAAEHNYKTTILEGIRTVIGVGFQLDDSIQKLNENQGILDSQDKSFITKIRKLLRDMMGKRPEDIIHEVDYMDPVSSERKNEAINFRSFATEVSKKAQTLIAMTSRNSTAYKRLEGASEDQIYKFLEKSIEDLQSYHRKLTALDEFFRATITDPEVRNRVRTIKTELGSIKNTIIKANQKRYEYIAFKDEQEQMKRLGIKES
ncbi:MAG: hypothetical protein A3J97_01770 [Spirochaetes bacterium RIFOXYC1_FULL_54_7]|nr:MAG: hypothetical protein A3J97_01770 [Spirochaetes bacterium RIFOXYC1_FULL_54_7]